MAENTKSKNINTTAFSLYSPRSRIVPLLGNSTNGQHHFQGLMPPGHMQMGYSQLRIGLRRLAAVRAPGGSKLCSVYLACHCRYGSGCCYLATADSVTKLKTHPTKAGGTCGTSECAEMAARSPAGTTMFKTFVRDKDRTFFLLNFKNKNNKL